MEAQARIFDRQLLWISIFAISMAFFESAIVVYIRALYYPEGFTFPLTQIEPHIGITEILREFFSLVMILSVAALTTRNFLRRFAHFLYIFALWDIFYYIFLKLLLGWPESLLTWDVLFLIPVTWSGPVITPVIVSMVMLLFALVIRHFHGRAGYQFYLEPREWVVLLAGAVVIFFSFIWDYTRFLITHIDRQILNDQSRLREQLEEIAYRYVPQDFNWLLYGAGIILLLISLVMIYRRNQKIWR